LNGATVPAYGSEFHLLRLLGRHRSHLDKHVTTLLGASEVGWLSAPHDPARSSPWFGDGEWKGLGFLADNASLMSAWREAWPARGQPPNWDAVGFAQIGSGREWLLVEAKAHTGELRSDCGAQEHGGRPRIAATMEGTKVALGASPDRDWLRGYYQYCNRIAVLNFLHEHGVPAHLLFIYFCGDGKMAGRDSPANAQEWQPALQLQGEHVGLSPGHKLEQRIHALFLPVDAAKLTD
jgi:hypothetical protein